jgi:predicted anti-sigma-YlaC factor YlaD
MNGMDHERARKLLAAAAVEGIASSERRRLDAHLAACSECSNEATALTDAVRALRAVPVVATPEIVLRTKLAVRIRSQELQTQRAQSTPLWIAIAVSTVVMVVTTPYVWQAFRWLGLWIQVPDEVWQIGFLMWWFLPATILAAAAALRHGNSEASNWLTENWGQR